MPVAFEAENIFARLGSYPVLGGVTFSLEEGEIGCVLGPSDDC